MGELGDLLILPVEQVAPRLLGSILRGNGVGVRLTEVEAYSGQGLDAASHAHRGPTPRTEIMFGPPGRLYVYFTYGMHWCANVVCGAAGTASAVLVRAGEVVDGVDLARRRRGESVPPKDLARGPARLAKCLGLDRDANGLDLLDPESPVRLELGRQPDGHRAGPRIGITKEVERPWRFWLADEPTVSGKLSGRR